MTPSPPARARAAASQSSSPLPKTAATSPPLQTPPRLPGPPPETAAHRHQWHWPSSLQPTASPPSSSPYNRVRSTSDHYHTHPHPPLLAPKSVSPTSLSTDCRRPSLSTVLLFHHLPSANEPTNMLATASSTSPTHSPVTLSPGAAGGQAPVELRVRHWPLVHGGQKPSMVHGPWTQSTEFPIQ
jgi:hypothetical protein